MEDRKKDEVLEKRLKCVFTVNSPHTQPSGVSVSPNEKELAQAHERLKRLEMLLAETKRKASSGSVSSGIIPAGIAHSVPVFQSPPHLMFPPVLVALLVLVTLVLAIFLQ